MAKQQHEEEEAGNDAPAEKVSLFKLQFVQRQTTVVSVVANMSLTTMNKVRKVVVIMSAD